MAPSSLSKTPIKLPELDNSCYLQNTFLVLGCVFCSENTTAYVLEVSRDFMSIWDFYQITLFETKHLGSLGKSSKQDPPLVKSFCTNSKKIYEDVDLLVFLLRSYLLPLSIRIVHL
jgi:hypothetical protein